MKTARALSANGYKEAGYEYIVVDDCWSERERDNQTGKLVPDLKRFPSGLKNLSDYVGIWFFSIHNIHNIQQYICRFIRSA